MSNINRGTITSTGTRKDFYNAITEQLTAFGFTYDAESSSDFERYFPFDNGLCLKLVDKITDTTSTTGSNQIYIHLIQNGVSFFNTAITYTSTSISWGNATRTIKYLVIKNNDDIYFNFYNYNASIDTVVECLYGYISVTKPDGSISHILYNSLGDYFHHGYDKDGKYIKFGITPTIAVNENLMLLYKPLFVEDNPMYPYGIATNLICSGFGASGTRYTVNGKDYYCMRNATVVDFVPITE